MELHGPPYEEILYFVRYKSPSGRTTKRTAWRMTPEEAARRFTGQWYELSDQDKIVILHPVNCLDNLYRHINTGMFMPPKED
jgi:hypothetical protein